MLSTIFTLIVLASGPMPLEDGYRWVYAKDGREAYLLEVDGTVLLAELDDPAGKGLADAGDLLQILRRRLVDIDGLLLLLLGESQLPFLLRHLQLVYQSYPKGSVF